MRVNDADMVGSDQMALPRMSLAGMSILERNTPCAPPMLSPLQDHSSQESRLRALVHLSKRHRSS